MPVVGAVHSITTGHAHPDKTFIGRIERASTAWIIASVWRGLSVAARTVEQFVARAIRLYEQEPVQALASARLGLYVRRWIRWTGAGLGRDDRKTRIIPDLHCRGPVCSWSRSVVAVTYVPDYINSAPLYR